jgi:hypothetical protein
MDKGSPMTQTVTHSPAAARHSVRLVLVGWLAMIGVDLFLHAGLLAPLYDWDSPFLLPAEQAFIRIPAGYLALLILAAALAWTLSRLGVASGREGARLAAAGGGVIWGSLVIGLWSISTAAPALLAAWWAGQTIELGVAGYLIGASLAGISFRRLALLAGACVLVGVVAAVVLQSIGYAPAVTISSS